MTDRIGPSFFSELQAAGVTCVSSYVNSTGDITYVEGTTDADKAKVEKLLTAHDPTKPGPAPAYSIYKTDVVSRMTDDELDKFDAGLTAATTRERRMWTDCTQIQSDSPYFTALQQQFAAAFGTGRATTLLAADGS